MTGPLRKLLAGALAGLALVAAGCADREEIRTLGETEGLYIDIGELKYQVQVSRILNPAEPEDGEYVRGVPAGEEPGAGETWFAVFLRVQNTTEDETLPTASEFEIVDTQENVYEPLDIEPADNPWIYEPTELGPAELVPKENSAQFSGTARGALLLFKVDVASLQNRPLEFEIHAPEGDAVGIIDLDV